MKCKQIIQLYVSKTGRPILVSAPNQIYKSDFMYKESILNARKLSNVLKIKKYGINNVPSSFSVKYISM